jgi:hypothetical protein
MIIINNHQSPIINHQSINQSSSSPPSSSSSSLSSAAPFTCPILRPLGLHTLISEDGFTFFLSSQREAGMTFRFEHKLLEP